MHAIMAVQCTCEGQQLVGNENGCLILMFVDGVLPPVTKEFVHLLMYVSKTSVDKCSVGYRSSTDAMFVLRLARR